MKKKIEKIINAYMSEYSDPLKKLEYPDLQQMNYPDQEQTYTDLTQLDSPHGESTFNERYKLVYPDQWANPSWADGDFMSPYENELTNMTKSPNDNQLLLHYSSEIQDLGFNKSCAVDKFLSPEREIIKISSAMDLTDFIKLADDTLIHKSKQDIWKMFKDENNDVYIKRMFEDDFIKE